VNRSALKNCTTAVFFCGLFWLGGGSFATGADLTVLPGRHQKISDWGLYPIEVFTDTLMNKPRIQELLFRDLKPTLLKVVIRNGCYDSAKDDGSLNKSMLDGTVVTQIRYLKQYDISGYFTTVDTPPWVWKRFPTIDGQQDLIPNPLIESREEDFARYIVNVLSEIRSRGLPLPRAHSIQSAATLMIGRPPSCPYTPEQWARVAVKTRKALDAAGLQEVKLIGPDDLSYQGTLDFLDGPAAARLGANQELGRGMDAFGFQGQIDRMSRGASVIANMTALCQMMADSGREIWMTGWADLRVSSDTDACLNVVRRLAGEMTRLRTNCWVWRVGYQNEQTAEALVYGEAETTPLYRVLKRLWNSARSGFWVRHVAIDDPSLQGTAERIEENAVAFEGPESVVILIANPLVEAKQLRVKTGGASRILIWTTGTPDAERKLGPDSVHDGMFEMKLDARTVAVIECFR